MNKYTLNTIVYEKDYKLFLLKNSISLEKKNKAFCFSRLLIIILANFLCLQTILTM